MPNNRMSIGVIIIILGIIILLGKLGVISFVWSTFWPLILLIPAVAFHLLYFGRTLPSGVLVPGGILATYALMFLFCELVGWHAMAYLWPGFILGVAIGLYEFYFFSEFKLRGVLIASLILGAISIVFFGFTLLQTSGIYFIAIALILVGVFMIFRRPNAF